MRNVSDRESGRKYFFGPIVNWPKKCQALLWKKQTHSRFRWEELNPDVRLVLKITSSFQEHFHSFFVKVCKSNKINRASWLFAKKLQRCRKKNLSTTPLRESKYTTAYSGCSETDELSLMTLDERIVHGITKAFILAFLASFPYWTYCVNYYTTRQISSFSYSNSTSFDRAMFSNKLITIGLYLISSVFNNGTSYLSKRSSLGSRIDIGVSSLSLQTIIW